MVIHNVITEYGDFLDLFVQYVRSGGKATADKMTAIYLNKFSLTCSFVRSSFVEAVFAV